ncbi:MAG: Mammalian cell entry related domain protein [Solirubrobacterales bacterium]|nr:Mammalian cell entry related domain protein [Solirubrobacterales bacterium]
MKAVTLSRVALLAALALVAVMLFTGGKDTYDLKLRMDNTGGLKNGSPVTLGGVRVGLVKVGVDTKASQAVVTLRIQDRFKPIGRDTRATIVAQNVLGQKQVQLTKGSASLPADSGFTIPRSHIVTGTDLDRVLDVLDTDTRTRLAIFLNEAGTALTGRRQDLSDALRDVGPAIGDADGVLRQLADENASLERLVQTGDRYVADVTRRKADVVQLIDRVGQAAVTGSTKQAQLRATLANAPGALQSLRGFLAELRATTTPLGPAARQLSAVALPLRTTLDRVQPFTSAARPALKTATDVAPTLVQLATQATPVLRKAGPALSALRTTAGTDLPPITKLTDRSFNNILAVLENWAGAIQFRDAASHIFRGEASVAPDALKSVIDRLAPRAKATKAKRRPSADGGSQAGAPAPAAPAPSRPSVPGKTLQLPGLPPITLPDVGKTVGGIVSGLTGQAAPKPGSPKDATSLLDYLMGK